MKLFSIALISSFAFAATGCAEQLPATTATAVGQTQTTSALVCPAGKVLDTAGKCITDEETEFP